MGYPAFNVPPVAFGDGTATDHPRQDGFIAPGWCSRRELLRAEETATLEGCSVKKEGGRSGGLGFVDFGLGFNNTP